MATPSHSAPDHDGAPSATESPLRRILRTMGLSVMTQGVASAGNLVLNLLLLRLLDIDDFGYYVYVFAFGSFGAAVTSSITGNVFHFCLPRLHRLHRGYETAYNGFNLIITTTVTIAVTLACLAFPHPPDEQTLIGIALFIGGLTAIESVKLQATANGRHPLNLGVEIGRQAVLLAIVIIQALLGHLRVADVMMVHGVTGFAACFALLTSSRGRLSFRNLGWIARRHWVYARHLLPSTLIATIQTSAMPLFVKEHFGLGAVGSLRSAELPFSAFNPIKQSIGHFLPRAIHDFERLDREPRVRRFRRIALASFVAVVVIAVAIWVVALAVMPLVTRKDYPEGIGLIYAAAYAAMMLQVVVNCYLNVVGRSANVLTQSIIGAVVTIGAYFALIRIIGPSAAPAAVALAFLSMTVYGFAALRRHVSAR